ncbi:MAG: NRDE family protein [Bacteroidia bacterium]
MCTLTYIPLKDGFLFTSNRDERRLRAPALPPEVYSVHGKDVLFPKDGEAGGTWVASSDSLQLCLLNGAFERHISHPPYRLSRGIVLLDAFGYDHFHDFFEKYSFSGIEPFSMIAIETRKHQRLYELRWDGKQVFFKTLDPYKAVIWSSASLYAADVRLKREAWFLAFREEKPLPTQEEVLHFHLFSGEGNLAHDLVMNHETIVQTLSVTSLLSNKEGRKVIHLDLLDGNYHTRFIPA